MKKGFYGIAVCCAMMLVACENQIGNKEPESKELTAQLVKDVDKDELVEVTFRMVDFDMTLKEMGLGANTRASLDGNVSYLNVALFKGETKAYEFTQTFEDENFGNISAKVVADTYSLVVIASKVEMEIEALTNIHPTGEKVNDTFYYYGTLQKSALTAGTVNVSLNRAVARFEFQTEPKPTEVKSFALELTGGSMSFNPVTGLGVGSGTQLSVIDQSNKADNAIIHCGIYTFLPSSNASVTVKATAYNASNEVVKSHTFTNVQMKPAYNTYYSGTFFQSDGTWAVTIADVSWPESITNTYDLSGN